MNICLEPGCHELSRTARCPAHTEARKRAPDTERPNASARGYTSKNWRNLRRLIIHRDCHCRWPGCLKPISDIDHIKPKSEGGEDFDMANLQGLCKRHHSIKTRKETARRNNTDATAQS